MNVQQWNVDRYRGTHPQNRKQREVIECLQVPSTSWDQAKQTSSHFPSLQYPLQFRHAYLQASSSFVIALREADSLSIVDKSVQRTSILDNTPISHMSVIHSSSILLQPATMDGTVSILDRLPFEMVAIIGHHAGRSTLYNLRLTCKTMANITELTFAKRFFSERRHIFSRHSLEELVAITAHPVFGCHVHAVILGQTRLLIPGLADLILFHGNRSDRTAIGEHREILDEQEILDHGGEALRLLTQAMTNISHHHDMITVGTWPDILIRDQTWEPWDPKETGFNEYHCQGCDTWLSGAGQFNPTPDSSSIGMSQKPRWKCFYMPLRKQDARSTP
ncbi:hypothetical protein BDV97DRAFT_389101 [Delphinella strobiligena]|nr:hypothetical protein BDV97DRAFT_389101 [Delphinella strobiligena]